MRTHAPSETLICGPALLTELRQGAESLIVAIVKSLHSLVLILSCDCSFAYADYHVVALHVPQLSLALCLSPN